MTNVFAVDVGGTRIKSGFVSPEGALLGARSSVTGRDQGWPEVLDRVTAIVAAALASDVAHDVEAIGIVVPGVVDECAGVARWSANLGWRDVPVREHLAREFNLPVALGHDVRCGAVAEARLGAARGTRSSLFIPIGTGIASALVIDGRVDVGARWAAGELGHVIVDPHGLPCACGRSGCLETLASAAAVGRRYTEASPSSTAHVTSADVCDLVDAGDPVAARIWTDAVVALGMAIETAILLCDPEIVVLGGGLSRSGDRLLDPLRKYLRSRDILGAPPPLAVAELGEWAGCLGAGLLAWDHVTGAATC